MVRGDRLPGSSDLLAKHEPVLATPGSYKQLHSMSYDSLRLFPAESTNTNRKKKLCPGPALWLDFAMDLEVESRVVCPYCGAVFITVVDTSSGTFSTIEDCEVCCRPIELNVHCHYGEIESVEYDRA